MEFLHNLRGTMNTWLMFWACNIGAITIHVHTASATGPISRTPVSGQHPGGSIRASLEIAISWHLWITMFSSIRLFTATSLCFCPPGPARPAGPARSAFATAGPPGPVRPARPSPAHRQLQQPSCNSVHLYLYLARLRSCLGSTLKLPQQSRHVRLLQQCRWAARAARAARADHCARSDQPHSG